MRRPVKAMVVGSIPTLGAISTSTMRAWMESVDTPRSKRGARKGMGVRVPQRAPTAVGGIGRHTWLRTRRALSRMRVQVSHRRPSSSSASIAALSKPKWHNICSRGGIGRHTWLRARRLLKDMRVRVPLTAPWVSRRNGMAAGCKPDARERTAGSIPVSPTTFAREDGAPCRRQPECWNLARTPWAPARGVTPSSRSREAWPISRAS